MKNTIAVFVGADDFECQQYYNADNNCDGVDIIYAEDRTHIGNIDNIVIPDLDDDDYDEKVIAFNFEVENYLNENYF